MNCANLIYPNESIKIAGTTLKRYFQFNPTEARYFLGKPIISCSCSGYTTCNFYVSKGICAFDIKKFYVIAKLDLASMLI